jgi:hypothetical protein
MFEANRPVQICSFSPLGLHLVPSMQAPRRLVENN